jgi:membrane associated rhomboid family serine protease
MSITLLLIVLTAAASFYAWNNADIHRKWMMNPYLVRKNKEYYRFITSGFIHSDIAHLVFNMYALFALGQYLEQIFEAWYGITGLIIYLALYILGIIVSDIPTYLKYNKDYNYNSLGASGGVSSVIFSFIIIAPLEKLSLFFIPMPAFLFGALYLIYSYMQARRDADQINHDAHFYGAIFGIVFTVLIDYHVAVNFFDQIIHWRLFD